MKSPIKSIIKRHLPRCLVVYRLRDHETNHVQFTFDDGPHHEVTPLVLDRLRDYGVRSAFFLAGRCIEEAVHVPEMILEAGHILGNHSYIHSNGRQPWFREYYLDLKKCQEIIEGVAGYKARFFRPPCGRILPKTLMAPRMLGMKTVMWSAGGEDWRCKTRASAKRYAEALVEQIVPGDIVMLHDDNPHVLEILDCVLPELVSRNVSLSGSFEQLV